MKKSEMKKIDIIIEEKYKHLINCKDLIDYLFSGYDDDAEIVGVDSDKLYDLADERADSNVDIYNADLRKKAELFQQHTEDAMDAMIEFGIFGEKNTLKILMLGQYNFYSEFARNVVKEVLSLQ